ncbi:MAG TPA: cytochrome c3 family protein [Methylomirabilota bacterium]|nr:cytochrome c3 family protein [Methylomirabilota bacterium]
MLSARTGLGTFLLLGAALSPAAGAAAQGKPPEPKPTAEDCLGCHADKDLKRSAPVRGRPESLLVDRAVLAASPHARLECVACHTTATAPHDSPLPPVRCAGCHDKARVALSEGAHATRGAQARGVTCTTCHGTHDVRPAAALTVETCASCHRTQVRAYRGSVHGRSRQRGDLEAATCRSCHGTAHAVLAKANPRSPTYHLNLPRTCAQCHADPELAKRHHIPIANVYELYMDSIHGRAVSRSGLLVAANCSDCHGSHEIQPHTEPSSRVFPANVPKTCGACHAGVLAAYAQSVHGRAAAKGMSTAPVCTDCHTAHQIRRVEGAPWQLEVIRECGSCHEESLKTYRDTFHGKVTTLGLTRVAKCADCHGAHTILPASDPASSVSPGKRVATCRQCHPGASAKFVEFHPHADPANKARFPRLYYSYVFMIALLVGTFAFFGLHTLLWLPRSLIERLRHGRPGGETGGGP